MRGTVACIVFSLAAVEVLGGIFYSEKENAVKEVEKKFEELKKVIQNVDKHVQDERNKKESEIENQVKDTLNTEKKKTSDTLGAEVTAATRSAIAKGKPLSVIDCITKVAYEGQDAITNMEKNIEKELNDIKSRKKSALDTAAYQIKLIETAARELKEESVKKINKAENGFQALQADAIKKMDAAKKQLEELEARISKPDLKTDFLALKRQIQPKFQEILNGLVKKIQKC